MARPVGKLFRPVVIEPELRELLDEILVAPSATDPQVMAAKRRIREKATDENSYLYAVEIRNYLEEKTRIGSEPRLFTVAGDLFLDALEAKLSSIGPNFFKDHYGGVLGCYKDGEDPSKAIEGPIYCLDLLLLRVLELALDGEASPAEAAEPLPAFMPAEASDPRGRVRECLKFADRILRDAVQQALNVRKGSVPPRLLDYVAVHRARMEKVVADWGRFLHEVHSTEPAESCLQGALEAAQGTGYTPLVAGVEERLALLVDPERNGCKESAHLYYDAADHLMSQGNLERESDAFNLALRRYARSVEIFERIRDRTSMAKALVEQARVFIRKGGDGENVRDALHRAVCLVVAHRDGLPIGRLPILHHSEVHTFLESKGYSAEAEAYQSAREKMSRQ